MTAAGIAGSYDLFEMSTLPKEGLKAFMQHHGLVGLNVTFRKKVLMLLIASMMLRKRSVCQYSCPRKGQTYRVQYRCLRY